VVRQSYILGRQMRPPIEYDPALPVCQKRQEIARAIEKSQVTIVCGETGSGKTTQLPKILLEREA
jgi:ATP-dependent helicase HrpA